MFSIPSFSKLIVLFVIIAVVWYGFRFLGEVERARRAADRGAAGRGPVGRGSARPGQRPASGGRRDDQPQIEDTVKCRVCGAYVPARQPARCSRSDCPY